jgi:hypothetical protein
MVSSVLEGRELLKANSYPANESSASQKHAKMSQVIPEIVSSSRNKTELTPTVASAGPPSYSEAITRHLNKNAMAPSIEIKGSHFDTHPNEAFVPPKPKRVKPQIDWAQRIPEYLRDLPKPEWMVERDAKRAAEAVKHVARDTAEGAQASSVNVSSSLGGR